MKGKGKGKGERFDTHSGGADSITRQLRNAKRNHTPTVTLEADVVKAAVDRAFRYANERAEVEAQHGKVRVIVKDGVPQV